MRVFNPLTRMLIQGLLLLTSATAFGGDGINVTINNNTTKELRVTVYDLNTSPAVRVVSSQTINGFASITVTITADNSGQGHLSWAATTVGPSMRMCGHEERRHLNDGDTVNVHAGSECAAN
jgi:hypothetical protein